MEITLKDDKLNTKKRIVVTELREPVGETAFYGITGRVWRCANNDETLIWLDKNISTTWSDGWDLIKIDAFFGSEPGRATEQFTAANQSEAWNRLATSFRRYTSTEIAIIKNWDADDDDDFGSLASWPGYGGQWCGEAARSQYWTNRCPNAYQKPKPKTAYYRVCGDEIGAHLYREQSHSWQKEGHVEPGQLVRPDKPKETLKKAAPESEEAVTRTVSVPHSPDAASRSCLRCGSELCSPGKCESPQRRQNLVQRLIKKGAIIVH